MSKQHIRAAYAKMDPVFMFDGLFVPMSGRKDRPKLYVPLRKFGACEIGFQGFDQTSAFDQSVLLAMSAQLGIDGDFIEMAPGGEISQHLRCGIYSVEEGKPVIDDGRKIMSKKTSLRSLLIDAGRKGSGGKDQDELKASLNRLRNAQIRERSGGTKWDRVCNLASSWWNDETEEVYMAINPRVSGAIFKGQHIKVSLFERNALESEVAKILHAWLCSNVRLGRSLGNGNGAMLDTLLPHVWGPNHDKKTSKKVMSVRRGRLREALDEIRDATRTLDGGYGWEIDRDSSDLIWIARPKDLPVQEAKFGLIPSDLDTEPLRRE